MIIIQGICIRVEYVVLAIVEYNLDERIGVNIAHYNSTTYTSPRSNLTARTPKGVLCASVN